MDSQEPRQETVSDTGNKASYKALFSIRNYRLLLMSQTVSVIGDGVYAIALIWLMKLLTGSALWMSVLLVAETLPLILLGMFAGVIVDRSSKRKILICCDIARGSIIVLVILLWATGLLQPYQLIMAALLLSSFTAFFGPARAVTVRNVVPDAYMFQAQSVSQLVQTVVGLTAPALGAFLLTFGTAHAFGFNAATFFISCLLLTLVRDERMTERKEEKMSFASLAADFKEGLDTIMTQPLLRNLIIYIMLINFMLSPTALLFPLMVSDSSELAVLEICFFIGIAAGAVVTGLVRRLPYIVTMSIGLGLLMTGLGMLFWIRGLVWEAMFVFVAGLGSPLANVTLQTLFMLKVPRPVLGRAAGMMRVLTEGSRPLAMMLTGMLLSWIPVRSFFGVVGIFGIVVIVLMVLNPAIRKDSDVSAYHPAAAEAGATTKEVM
ncbi:MFS transporter [Paenibacillus terreus]|uniref:MFS transporter n=1 Tax=Paenibacillus terreus TaxID=1387834 RepID=A0ABV5BCK5_9BACL